MRNVILLIVGICIAIFVVTKCKTEPKIVTVTEIEYVTKTDTITNTVIKKEFLTKYVTKIKTLDGRDSIVYVDKQTRQAIKVREYEAVVQTDSSRADLKITSTGEVLDVKGTITYDQKQTTTTITKFKESSGLFLYAETSLQPSLEHFELGLDYQFKNKIIIGVSGSVVQDQFYFNAKLGFKIF